MIARGSILSGPMVFGRDPEVVGQLTDLLITGRALIWDKIVEIFQVSDVWTYLKTSKRHHDKRMGYKLIYNNYICTRNIYHMEAGADKKLDQCT